MENEKDIIKYATEHPDETVGELMKRFKIRKDTAFYVICEAAKLLNKKDK